MKPIKIFRHIDCEGPGYFAEFLQHKKIPYTIVCIDQGESFSNSLDDCSALVFMGSGMSVNDDLAWIKQELDLIRSALAKNVPILGHCFGGQLLAKALGAKVSPHTHKEIGWYDIVCDANNTWFDFTLPTQQVFHWHGETFNLPNHAQRLFYNEACHQQGFAFGTHCLGLQFHIEMTSTMVKSWVEQSRGELKAENYVQTATEILDQLENKCRRLHQFADKIYETWLSNVCNLA